MEEIFDIRSCHLRSKTGFDASCILRRLKSVSRASERSHKSTTWQLALLRLRSH